MSNMDIDVKKEITKVYVPSNAEELGQKGTAAAARQIARLRNKIISKVKKPSTETRNDMVTDGNKRKACLQKLKGFTKDPNHYAMSSAVAAKTWVDFVKANDAGYAYGLDAIGLKNREKSKKIGFRLTGAGGKFTPFVVVNGILRGGETGHMTEEGGGRASIPTELSDTRKLVSCRGKYTDPSMFPASRIVKFMRGAWGKARKLNSYERI